MAMISCPECGKEVSSLSKNCIHCGCPITVCPECNAVITGEVSVCGRCGHKFHRVVEAKQEEVIQAPPKNCTQVCQAWKSSTSFYRNYYTVTRPLLLIFSLLIFLVGAFVVIYWIVNRILEDTSSMTEVVISYKSTLKAVKITLFFASCFFVSLSICDAYAVFCAPIKLNQYAESKGIDLIRSLDYTLSTDFSTKSKIVLRRDGSSAFLVAKTILYKYNYDAMSRAKKNMCCS